MIVSYYPGCTLKAKARELDESAVQVMAALGVEAEELPEWQCCGAAYPVATNETARRFSAVRALYAARELGRPLVTVCSACHHVLKRINHEMAHDPVIRDNVCRGLDISYAGETPVIHLLELLRDQVGFDQVRGAVKKPLTCRKAGAYYGCLLLRPSAIMALDDPEDPSVMEELLTAIGVEPVYFAQRNECCGSHQVLLNPELAAKNSRRILDGCAARGGETLVTACPLCCWNLRQFRQPDSPQVVYFTELLAEALGCKEDIND